MLKCWIDGHCWHKNNKYEYSIIEHGSKEFEEYKMTSVLKCCWCSKTRENYWGEFISFDEYQRGILNE